MLKMIQAGTLRHAVTIQQPSTTGSTGPDAYGVETPSWVAYHTCKAAILPETGREFYYASQVHAEITHLLRIRYKAGVTAKMRVVYGSRHLYISAVRDLEERGRVQELVCVEQE